MSLYDGSERRKKTREDGMEMHDAIIRIDANLSNFMKRFDEHVTKDDQHFERLYNKTSSLSMYLWMGMGGLGVVTFLIEKVFK